VTVDEIPRITLGPIGKRSVLETFANALKRMDWLLWSATPFAVFVQVNLKDSPSGWFNSHIHIRF
jgi:hypothetical protein